MAAEQERARLQAVADGKAAAASDPAQDDLSLHTVKEVIAKVRKNDAKKAFDIAAYNQFNATPLTVAPTSGSTSAHPKSARKSPMVNSRATWIGTIRWIAYASIAIRSTEAPNHLSKADSPTPLGAIVGEIRLAKSARSVFHCRTVVATKANG